MQFLQLRRALSAPCTQPWWWQCFSPEHVAPRWGNSGSGITDRWPGYCCLWYLLVNFCNQYNISQQSPWEWKPETAHLILEPAPAPCSAAKLGSWPTWCSIIAAEVRCELSCTGVWWMAVFDKAPLPSNKRRLIMMDHNCTQKNPCRRKGGKKNPCWLPSPFTQWRQQIDLLTASSRLWCRGKRSAVGFLIYWHNWLKRNEQTEWENNKMFCLSTTLFCHIHWTDVPELANMAVQHSTGIFLWKLFTKVTVLNGSIMSTVM